MVLLSSKKKGGWTWLMHGYSAEPIEFREGDESFTNITRALSYYAMAASSWVRTGAVWMWILRMRRSVLYA
jgi:hypothetical protein